jgi:AraC-like DNA-binding protein
MDALSEILSGLKLNGALFFNAEFSAPWGVVSPGSEALGPVLAPGAQHLVIFHFVAEGHGLAFIPDGPSLALEPGDVVAFPHGDRHLLTSGGRSEHHEQTLETIKKIRAHDLTLLRVGGGGEATRLICGFMACDPHLGRPVLGGLPSMFKVNIRTDNSGRWLESSILHLVGDAASGGVGTEAVLSKLSETLFVDTLRRYIGTLPEQQTGWLGGARDVIVGKSLALLHRRVGHPWTIAALADEIGVSRSTLVERFTNYLGEPPMTYLTRWRLQLAARSLLGTAKGVAQIASEVGYESEAAFNRAFKRELGLPPARYRREMKRAKANAAGA